MCVWGGGGGEGQAGVGGGRRGGGNPGLARERDWANYLTFQSGYSGETKG